MKGVLIIAEHLEGRLAPSTPELIATGRSLAAALGGAARIAVLGSGVRELAERLAGYTLDVLLAQQPALAEYTGDGYVQAVRGMVESNPPRAILVAHSSQGYDFASALAGAMDLPLVTNCLGLDVDGDRLVATRRLLNEKVQAKVEIHSERPIVVTMRPGAEKPMGPGRGMMTVTAVPVVIEPSAIRETFLRLERPQVQDIDLSGADIIVSAGRGIQKKENLVLIEEFAKATGGVSQPQAPVQPPQPPPLGTYRVTGPRGPPQAAVIGVVLVVLLLAVFGIIMLPLAGGSLMFSGAAFLCVPVIFVAIVLILFFVQGVGRRTIPAPPPIQQPMVPAGQQGPVALNCPNCGGPRQNVDRFGISPCPCC